MKNILVPVDFSDQSIYAFRTAVEIAERSTGKVVLLHVITLPVLHDSPLVAVDSLREPLVDELTDVALEKMRHVAQEFSNGKTAIEYSVKVSNNIHATISKQINEKESDLVIMGTKGASGIREWIIGSNTEKVVRTCPVPVIAVKSFKQGRNIKDIVFPNTLDLDDQEDLIMKVKALQNFFDATLHIIRINTPALFQPDAEIRKKLDAFARRFMLKNYTINVINYSDEESGILEFTRQIQGDLIAMGTQGLTGLAHLISGSIAEDVVNHVEYPVWTYRTKPSKVTTQN